MSCTFGFTKTPLDAVFSQNRSYSCTIAISGTQTTGTLVVDAANQRINISFGPISGFSSTTYTIRVICNNVTVAEFNITLSGVSSSDNLIFDISFTY